MQSLKILFGTATLAVSACLLLNGCGGISSRIKKHEREFGSYPPEVQAQIQSGRIDRGFTEDMVFLARGEPSDKTQLKRDGRIITVWKYARPNPMQPPSASGNGLAGSYGYPGFGPGPSQPAPLLYDKSYFKIEFENGKVVRWDQDLQDDVNSSDMKLPATPYNK